MHTIQIKIFNDSSLYFLTAGIYSSRHIRWCRLSNCIKISNEESRMTYSTHTFMSKYFSTIHFPLYTVKGWVFWNEMFRREQLKSMIWFLIELPFDMVQLHLQDIKTNLQNFACYKYIPYFLNQYPPLNNTPLW